ncbi:MAG: FtsW/RodA/SpoVE family cell cycle protein, partial [Alistipes sp.]|nr:FtsW/RodA/SpoVE family cell cycle protein [Alistipes sp.]
MEAQQRGQEAAGQHAAPESPQEGSFRLFTGDRVLWIIIAALAVISVLVVYSSTAKMAYDAHTARSTTHFLRQQLMILTVCVPLIILTHKINSRVYNHLAVLAYGGSILLTVAVYFIGATTNGAARWIPLGPFQFQPSEALKVATVLLLARQLAGRQSVIDKLRIIPSLNPLRWQQPAQRKIWREGTWPILVPVLLACVVIFPAHPASAVLVFIASGVMVLIGR